MEENIYLIMNKPCGYVCSAVSDSHKTVYELLTAELQALVRGAKRGHRLHTIGRLDAETSGLLLFTTDGMFSHRVAARDSGIEKTYVAKLECEVSPENQEIYKTRASKGLTLPAEKKAGEQECEPAILTFTSPNLCQITIHEGKFHEVRRIFRALGNEVKELKRISIGNLSLPKELKQGQWRPLTQSEINLIF